MAASGVLVMMHIMGTTPAALLAQARDYVRAEGDRATALQTRATAAVASAAVIISLTVTVGRDLFAHAIPVVAFRAIFVATLTVLLMAATLSGVALWPPASYAASVEEIEDYLADDSMNQSERDAARTLISSLHYELASTRSSNDTNAKWLRRGIICLVVGALGAAALGATLGVTSKKRASNSERSGSTTIRVADQPVPVTPSTNLPRKP